MRQPKMEYSISERTLTITDEQGRVMRISGLSAEQAERFASKHAGGFISRGFRLETSGSGDFVRA